METVWWDRPGMHPGSDRLAQMRDKVDAGLFRHQPASPAVQAPRTVPSRLPARPPTRRNKIVRIGSLRLIAPVSEMAEILAAFRGAQ